jgi:hypothetical protein
MHIAKTVVTVASTKNDQLITHKIGSVISTGHGNMATCIEIIPAKIVLVQQIQCKQITQGMRAITSTENIEFVVPNKSAMCAASRRTLSSNSRD